jgi:hypothetical protein
LIVVCSNADAPFCVVCLLRLCCSLSLQVGQATLEQLLPYLGPAEDMQAQFKAAHQKLLTEIDQLKIANLDETGGDMSFLGSDGHKGAGAPLDGHAHNCKGCREPEAISLTPMGEA